MFLPCDARRAQCKARYSYRKSSVRPSVRPSDSVCLSVTLTYRGHIGGISSKLITRVISLGSLLLGATTSAIQSKGNTPKIRVEQWWGRSLIEPAISLKRGKTGPRLLLMTYRKSHTRFRLVPKPTTLDDLEGPLLTLFQNTCLSEPITKYKVYADIRGGSQDLCKFSLDFLPAPVRYVYTYLTLFSLSSSTVLCTTVIYEWLQRRVVKCRLAEMWQADQRNVIRTVFGIRSVRIPQKNCGSFVDATSLES